MGISPLIQGAKAAVSVVRSDLGCTGQGQVFKHCVGEGGWIIEGFEARLVVVRVGLSEALVVSHENGFEEGACQRSCYGTRY